MEGQYTQQRCYMNGVKLSIPPEQSDNDRSSGELRALDCNVGSLCDHIRSEGFNAGAFSDIVVQAMGISYHLHRLILSRSSYFRNMLQGPWKEANAPTVTLHIDDDNVNSEAIAMALAYLYGHHPRLNDNNAFRVLAAASFLDLQDLCAICTDFIISELWTSNFLAYQIFAESQDYGIHGERVRNACWGYLCQSGTIELKEVLPKLSSQTLHALLTSDELWVPSEEKRFELALYALLAKSMLLEADNSEEPNSEAESSASQNVSVKGKNLVDASVNEQLLESGLGGISLCDKQEGHKAAHKILVELADCVVDFNEPLKVQQGSCSQQSVGSKYANNKVGAPNLPSNLHGGFDTIKTCNVYVEMQENMEESRMSSNDASMEEGPSDENSSPYHGNHDIWVSRDESKATSSIVSPCNGVMLNDWGRCNLSPSPSWGGRVVGRRQAPNYVKGRPNIHSEEYDAFLGIFEGGSLLYCNMSFDALLDVRRQLEELGFPCKAVCDGLWLQTLLSQRVQDIGADTCKHCSLMSILCACRQPYGFSHGGSSSSYYRHDHDRNNGPNNIGNLYLTDAQGEASGLYGPVRVHVRGPVDGLAGIGRGTTLVPAPAWPPTRFVFSRVPFGLGNRSCQQSHANDESDGRVDLNGGDASGDGLTALVGLSQGSNCVPVIPGQSGRLYEQSLQSRTTGIPASVASTSGISMQTVEQRKHGVGLEWENVEGSTIFLDSRTPLRSFPPFRFGVEFEDVHRLSDGQVKHSPEVFYAGSLWKVSAQAFSDEDPQGRRTIGLFLHRRKAEAIDHQRKVYPYVDIREKVKARYQLICPSKREVMVFASVQEGTLLPKAPKGWGWRRALLFDELADLVQAGALRVAAVVQLV
ncbi:hypothetical protein AMTRI_Chr02g222970 [Amborella trichopoda]|uniref:BTB domain-containing protein n=1 Tax=Amborella trichopoda TaxID=13333 RepID=W1P2S8_AMBTC|nr:uncharacterized protein LOC18430306 [Amborella trichopoda]ERN02203.1 hypothetical protein AMTR_s00045p00208580 [Amborella trichopoda]|eukprot:XP_006840528.1 uncharacterized protein LOC18430306 [Amborella trichopoda]